ncbi:DUF6241 domain-containing protein [Lederbergia sp. NSJ-179]|uniref:DUF6241 domain-containing protein n=1 Tax=Lederbergia sp. NSJ-179 TaxID=2931402 RepID=UPI001FD49208|nr:DUF6241 domain-containing protein [Lederbergia sp. NSJ-179]MCJ7840033.1 DUF6241 domain-containing protein [Lederbergia sp. NSJ-179]
MYKKIVWSLIGFIVVLVGIFFILVFTDSPKSPEEAHKDKKETEVHAVTAAEENDVEEGAETPNPFGQKSTQEELTDSDYRNYIHKMSHQKVKADEKWGFYEITPERIDWLLQGLNQVNLKNESVYRDILERWKDGDFSKVDQDHNAIWQLQGGTIGKATGILSPEEEEAFLQETEEQQ